MGLIFFKRMGLGFVMLAGLVACAKPATSYPVIPVAEIDAATLADQRASVEARLDRQARVNAIAWPLLVGGAGLCHERRADRFGISLGNDRMVRELADGFTLEQVNAMGYDSSPVVLNVVAGSPAARAGLMRGAVPVSVGGVEIKGKMATLNLALANYKSKREKAKEAQLAGEREAELPSLEAVFALADGRTLAVDMSPQEICNIAVNVSETDTVNASTGGTSVNVFRGLLTYMEDDDDVAIVVAHEIGHVIGGHVPKQRRNALVSGFALWGVPVGVGATLFDRVFATPLERWRGVETPPGRASMTRISNRVLGVRSFEREADYLGMYIAARGGVDITDAEAVFAGFAKLSPASTYGERTHPVTPERQLALKAAREEIAAKRAAGEALIPNGWPFPVPLGGGEADADGAGG